MHCSAIAAIQRAVHWQKSVRSGCRRAVFEIRQSRPSDRSSTRIKSLLEQRQGSVARRRAEAIGACCAKAKSGAAPLSSSLPTSNPEEPKQRPCVQLLYGHGHPRQQLMLMRKALVRVSPSSSVRDRFCCFAGRQDRSWCRARAVLDEQ